MARLNLSVDDRVVRWAKQYAKRHGISVSSMVETYLAIVADPQAADGATPILRLVRGIVKEADLSDYGKHLAAKCR